MQFGVWIVGRGCEQVDRHISGLPLLGGRETMERDPQK